MSITVEDDQHTGLYLGDACAVCGNLKPALVASGLHLCEPCAGKLTSEIAEHFIPRGPELSDAVHPAQAIGGIGYGMLQMALDLQERAANEEAVKQAGAIHALAAKCIEASRTWVLADAEQKCFGRSRVQEAPR